MGERLEQTIQVVEQLEEVLREGRILLKDIKHERKELERVLAETKDAVKKQVQVDIDAAVEGQLDYLLKEVSKSIVEAQDAAIKKVTKNFDNLANMLTHGNAQGRGPGLVQEYMWKRNK